MRRPLASLLLAATLPAQVLVKDITTTPDAGGSNPDWFTTVGSFVLFGADDGVVGRELWRTDGTSTGTALVADVNPGKHGSTPHGILPMGSFALFLASDDEHGLELWRTDGTAAGTTLVFESYPGPKSSLQDATPARVGSLAFFWVGDVPAQPTSMALWKTDGTAAGTATVGNFQSGYPGGATEYAGKLAFVAGSGGSMGLWITDGTPAGTGLVKTITGGQLGAYFRPKVFQGRLYFASSDAATGVELWSTDGTPAGTQILMDIAPGPASSLPNVATVVGGTLFFMANDGQSGAELWATNGAAAGTRLVKDIRTGSGSGGAGWLTDVQGLVFFSADDGAHGQEPWFSDGTSFGTQLIADVFPGNQGGFSGALGALGGSLLFSSSDGATGIQLWTTDGTANGTRRLYQVQPQAIGGKPTSARLGGSLVFAGTTSASAGFEPWITDGTSAGTRVISPVRPPHTDSSPAALTAALDTLYFVAGDAAHGRELWKSDGTSAGTTLVTDLRPGPDSAAKDKLFELGGRVLFFADTTRPPEAPLGYGREDLYASDGTSQGTVLLAAPSPSLGYSGSCVRLKDCLVFGYTYTFVQGELWRSDGTPGGTSRIWSSLMANWPSAMCRVGTRAFVTKAVSTSTSPVRELQVSDGTAAGTSTFASFQGLGYSGIYGMVGIGARAFFYVWQNGRPDLWSSDGTQSGTLQITDATQGELPDWDDPDVGSYLAGSGGVAFFTTRYPRGNHALWRSDGTKAGTVKLREFTSLFRALLTDANGTLLFAADDGARGRELWTSDGTATGTRLVMDLAQGAGSGLRATDQLVVVGSSPRVLFAADLGALGQELFVSDGTSTGTHIFADLAPGPAGSYPRDFARVGDSVYLTADDGVHGRELWRLPLRAIGGAFADPAGAGCAGSLGVPALGARGAPVLGSAGFALALGGARAGAPLLWLCSASRAEVPWGTACTSYPALPAIAIAGASDAAGSATLPLPVPASSSLLGAELWSQCLVADPAGAWLGAVAFSDGLRILVGS